MGLAPPPYKQELILYYKKQHIIQPTFVKVVIFWQFTGHYRNFKARQTTLKLFDGLKVTYLVFPVSVVVVRLVYS